MPIPTPIVVRPFASDSTLANHQWMALGLSIELTRALGEGAVLAIANVTDDDATWRKIVWPESTPTATEARAMFGDNTQPAAILVGNLTIDDEAMKLALNVITPDDERAIDVEIAANDFSLTTLGEAIGVETLVTAATTLAQWRDYLTLVAAAGAVAQGHAEDLPDDVDLAGLALSAGDAGREGFAAYAMACASAEHRCEATMKALKRVTKKLGDSTATWRATAKLLTTLDKHRDAGRAWREVLEGKQAAEDADDRATAALEAGRAFNRAELFENAQQMLTRAMSHDATKVDAVNEAAVSAISLGEIAVAERLWQRVTELDPRHLTSRVNLAHLYRARGDTKKADREFETILGLDGLDTSILADVGEHFLSTGKHEKALKTAEKFVALHPVEPLAHLFLASALNSLGRHKRAAEAVAKAEVCTGVDEHRGLLNRQRRYADHPETEERFAKFAKRAVTGDAAKAAEGLGEILDAHPDFWEAKLFRAIALRRDDRANEALALLEPLAKSRDDASVLKELTLVYALTGRKSKALAAAKRAFDVAPNDLGALLNYATSLLENGDIKAAEKYAKRATLHDSGEAAQNLLERVQHKKAKRGTLSVITGLLRRRKSSDR